MSKTQLKILLCSLLLLATPSLALTQVTPYACFYGAPPNYSYVLRAGDTMSGDLNMSWNDIWDANYHGNFYGDGSGLTNISVNATGYFSRSGNTLYPTTPGDNLRINSYAHLYFDNDSTSGFSYNQSSDTLSYLGTDSSHFRIGQPSIPDEFYLSLEEGIMEFKEGATRGNFFTTDAQNLFLGQYAKMQMGTPSLPTSEPTDWYFNSSYHPGFRIFQESSKPALKIYGSKAININDTVELYWNASQNTFFIDAGSTSPDSQIINIQAGQTGAVYIGGYGYTMIRSTVDEGLTTFVNTSGNDRVTIDHSSGNIGVQGDAYVQGNVHLTDNNYLYLSTADDSYITFDGDSMNFVAPDEFNFEGGAFFTPTINLGNLDNSYGIRFKGEGIYANYFGYRNSTSRYEFDDDVYAPNFIGNFSGDGSGLTNVSATLDIQDDEWLWFNTANTDGIRHNSSTGTLQFSGNPEFMQDVAINPYMYLSFDGTAQNNAMTWLGSTTPLEIDGQYGIYLNAPKVTMPADKYLYLDGSSKGIEYNSAKNVLHFNHNSSFDGVIILNSDTPIYFDNGTKSKSLHWDTGTNRFEFNNNTFINGTLQTADDIYTDGNIWLEPDKKLILGSDDVFIRYNTASPGYMELNSNGNDMVYSGNNFYPETDLGESLGYSGKRWDNIWGGKINGLSVNVPNGDNFRFVGTGSYDKTLGYNLTRTRFELNDDLFVNGTIQTNGSIIIPSGKHYYMEGSETGASIYFDGSNIALTGNSYIDGSLYVGEELHVQDAFGIYFDDSGETITWSDDEGRFKFSDDLDVAGNITAQNAKIGNTVNNLNIATDGSLTLKGTARKENSKETWAYNLYGLAGTYNGSTYDASTLASLGSTLFQNLPATGGGAAVGGAFVWDTTLPPDRDEATNITIRLHMQDGTTETCNVLLAVGERHISDGQTYAQTTVFNEQTLPVQGTQYIKFAKDFKFNVTNIPNSNTTMSFTVYRNGESALDTCAGSLYVSNIEMRYITNKLGE